MTTQISVNIGSGDDLLPDGAKPLPEPKLTNQKLFHGIHQEAISQEMLRELIRNMCSEIRFFKLLQRLPGTSELSYCLKISFKD